MHKVLILGAGKIGALISGLLAESNDYEVHLGDIDANAAANVVSAHELPHLYPHRVDAGHRAELDHLLAIHPVDAVVSSLPFYCNVAVAEAAPAPISTISI